MRQLLFFCLLLMMVLRGQAQMGDSLLLRFEHTPSIAHATALAEKGEEEGRTDLLVIACRYLAQQDSKLLPKLWSAYYRDGQWTALEESLTESIPRRGKDPHATARTLYQSRLAHTRRLLGQVSWLEVVDSVSIPMPEVASYLQSRGISIVSCDSLGLGYVSDRRDRYILPMRLEGQGNTRLVMGNLLPGEALPTSPPADARVLVEIPDSLHNPSYPSLAPDGTTLYFSAESDEGLGGRELFMTRPTASGGYLQPVALGLPFNSPGEDLLLVFQAECNAGYLVTTRFAPRGCATLYRFVYNGRWSSVPNNDPTQLRPYAQLRPYHATQSPKEDYSAWQRPCPGGSPSTEASVPGVEIVIAPDLIYRSREQFRALQASVLYERYVTAYREISTRRKHLARLRSQYRSNNSLGKQIKQLEQELPALEEELTRLVQEIRRLEAPYL